MAMPPLRAVTRIKYVANILKHEFDTAILYTRTRIIRHQRDTTWGPIQLRNLTAFHSYSISRYDPLNTSTIK